MANGQAQAMQANNDLINALQNNIGAAAMAVPVATRTEIRVEGLQIPKYSGRMNESVGLYIHKCKMYFKLNRWTTQIPAIEQRCISINDSQPNWRSSIMATRQSSLLGSITTNTYMH